MNKIFEEYNKSINEATKKIVLVNESKKSFIVIDDSAWAKWKDDINLLFTVIENSGTKELMSYLVNKGYSQYKNISLSLDFVK